MCHRHIKEVMYVLMINKFNIINAKVTRKHKIVVKPPANNRIDAIIRANKVNQEKLNYKGDD